MLTPKTLQNLPKGLTDIYSELSEFVLRDIARRISKAAEITDTAEYQLYRARALGLSTKEITAEIARINGAAESEIEKIIREAAEKSDEFDRRMLGADGAAVPFSENEQLQIMMAAEIDNTRGQCKNYTGTLGFAEVNASGNVVYSSMTDFLRRQMDMAHMKVASGVTDYNTAIRQACRALSESGLRTVYYESGRSDRIEAAVRRALMTTDNFISAPNATVFALGRGLKMQTTNDGKVIVALGQYNAETQYVTDSQTQQKQRVVFMIGNGTNDETRSSGFVIDEIGNVYCNRVYETGTSNIEDFLTRNSASSAQSARAITSAASAGLPIVLLDHAPTAEDLTGSPCVFLQCEENATVEGETTGIFKVTDIFAEK